ncbi:IS91 family transposase [Brassicibacter mesophilus]|uniref:IS91 family transposase n=1 Tax=Brassicibacter mesophilus TaxID=745119 RepID=UPI003D1952B4
MEVADIFSKYGEAYREKYKLPLHTLKTMSDIEFCRTDKLGGHIDKCDECGHIRISYNSCRNRHCPKCQSLNKERWLEERKKDLLPIQYFHVVFTIPDELNPLTLRNKKEIYSILFKASSETLIELSEDIKYLGANIGFISILHTWGQNLMDHPHIHCIVTGGGLSPDEKRWISSKKDFFIPVKVMSRLFRGKFLYYLKKSYYNSKLKFDGIINGLVVKKEFQKLIDNLYKKEWVVYSKPPFRSAEYVLEYLGRYTHKVAISNHRILKLEDNKVTFKWRDYRDDNKNKTMTLDVFEFIRRFLLHILPRGFVKIRHYGILSNRNRVTKLKKSKQLLKVFKKTMNAKDKESWQELILRLTGVDYTICPCCGKGSMVRNKKINPRCYSPPGVKMSVA